MALAVVQQTNVGSGGGNGDGVFFAANASWTFASTPTAGNLIVVVVTMWDNGSSITGVTDNKGNSYTEAYQVDNNNARVAVYYAENITTSATHTITVSTTGAYGCFCAVEVSGAATSSSRDTVSQTTDITDVSGTTTSITSGTLDQADSIVFANYTHDADTIITNPGSPWNSLYVRASYGSDHHGAAVYQIVSSTTALTSTWTYGTLPSVDAAKGIVAFKMATAVGGSPRMISIIYH